MTVNYIKLDFVFLEKLIFCGIFHFIGQKSEENDILHIRIQQITLGNYVAVLTSSFSEHWSIWCVSVCGQSHVSVGAPLNSRTCISLSVILPHFVSLTLCISFTWPATHPNSCTPWNIYKLCHLNTHTLGCVQPLGVGSNKRPLRMLTRSFNQWLTDIPSLTTNELWHLLVCAHTDKHTQWHGVIRHAYQSTLCLPEWSLTEHITIITSSEGGE